MHAIEPLLRKMQDLCKQPDEKTAIDIDLMLDYSRQIYGILLEMRAVVPEQTPHVPVMETSSKPESTILENPIPVADDPGVSTRTPPIVLPAEPEPAIELESAQPILPRPNILPQKDIRKLIGINDKYQIISELFHNDKDAYENAIREINNSSSFTEATDWLHTHVSWNYNWNEDNYTVQLFYGLIGQFYSEKDR